MGPCTRLECHVKAIEHTGTSVATVAGTASVTDWGDVTNSADDDVDIGDAMLAGASASSYDMDVEQQGTRRTGAETSSSLGNQSSHWPG